MAQYKIDNITDIYWASNEGFKAGRDPMGIQNSSVATYSVLLPGLTNLTGHIRYYSLYCWLLDEYNRLDKLSPQKVHQYDFIRRFELAMAILMNGQGMRAVVGANFVYYDKMKRLDDGSYYLPDGADYDIPSNRRYWTLKTGAFGQYYLGSLIFYDLVKIEQDRLFYLLSRGKALANDVRDSVDEQIRNDFVQCLLSGILKKEQLEEFRPLMLNQIEVYSPEWNTLNDFLIKPDSNNSALRRETMLLFLKDINRGIAVDNFVKHRFNNVDKGIPASFGWYFYHLCEVMHYCIETIFSLILSEIDNLNNPSASTLKQEIVQSIITKLEGWDNNDSISLLKDFVQIDICDAFDKLKNIIKRRDYIEGSALAIKLMLQLYKEYETNKDDINHFERYYYLIRQRGIFGQGIKDYVGRYHDFTLGKYLDALLSDIMNQHTYVAIRKTGNNNADLRKFIDEDGRIYLVEMRYPSETTPRINSLYNFLQDLKYINQDNQLTDIAKQFIENDGKKRT